MKTLLKYLLIGGLVLMAIRLIPPARAGTAFVDAAGNVATPDKEIWAQLSMDQRAAVGIGAILAQADAQEQQGICQRIASGERYKDTGLSGQLWTPFGTMSYYEIRDTFIKQPC
jgi:hypothetical protein